MLQLNAPAFSGRYSLLQQVHFIAPGYPASTLSCARQLRATCIYAYFVIPGFMVVHRGPCCPRGTCLARWHTARKSGILCLRIFKRAVVLAAPGSSHGNTLAHGID